MKLSVNKHTQKLISFIEKSPTPFHAVSNIVSILKDSGALSFDEADHTAIEPGNTYYVTRGMSSVIAFKMPENPKAFMICASHTDSPCFKLKPDFHKKGAGGLIMLDTEKYGGMINSSWLDRPLSVAGRVAIRSSAGITLRNVNIDRDLLVIPNVCIHFNRSINDGFKYNPQTDLSPVYAEGTDGSSLIKLIANELEIDESAIISHDLYVYNRTKGTFWGADNEFFSAPRIDNLQCTYSTLMGFFVRLVFIFSSSSFPHLATSASSLS